MECETARGVLAVLAHPDDETLIGGTLARCSSAGVPVTVVCTTDGGGGNAPESMTPEQLRCIRKQAMRRACQVLGVQRVEFFERDSAHTEHLSKENYAGIISEHRRSLVRLLHELRPRAVITFGSDGFTGHPTHVMVGFMTVQAVLESTVDAALYAIAVAPEHVDDIYAWMDAQLPVMQAFANETAARPNLGPARPSLVPGSRITTRIPVGHLLALRQRAWRCHETQGGGGSILDAFAVIADECYEHLGVTGTVGEDPLAVMADATSASVNGQ